MNHQKQSLLNRSGFTLMELLVAMVIMIIIASLAASIAPRAQEKDRVAKAASTVQSWFTQARQWALRDRSPRGIRLVVDPNRPTRVSTLQYIERPDDFVAPFSGTLTATFVGVNGTIQSTAPTGANLVDFSGGHGGNANNPVATRLWPIQVGDFIEVNPTQPMMGQIFFIKQIQNVNIAQRRYQLSILGPDRFNRPSFNINDFRIVRQPRPRVGEPALQMPPGTAIDLFANATYGAIPNTTQVNLNTPYYDILFAPSGDVIAPQGLDRAYKLWIIDAESNVGDAITFTAEQAFVTVSMKTGLVAVKQVDTTPNPPAGTGTYTHPYAYTQDGKASGF